ncbi:hypothetical protein BDQ17DRAFT_1328820 [Cyathus striatus]|nr:hypothetical protein BDQ17DRAFT_1328820 [Cyathus striatus]
MAKSSSTPLATLHPTNIRWSSRLQSTSSQPSTSLSKRKTTKKQNSLTPVTEQNPGGDTMKPASSPNVSYLPPLYLVVDPPGKSSVMSILTKVITMSSGLEVVSEGGSSVVPIATDFNTASDEEMGKDMGKDLDINNEGGNDMLSTATAPKAASEVAMGNEGGNKELPLLPTAIAANAASEAAMGNTNPTATAPTAPISTDPITGSIFQEGNIPKVRQTLASNYIPDALAKLKATSHKYFSKEGLYIHMSPWNDGNLDPIPYSYEKGSKATKRNGEENSSNFLILGVPGEKNTVKGQNDLKRSAEDSQTAIHELQWYHSWNVSGLVEARSNRKQQFVLMSIDVDSYDRMSVEERMGII